MLKVIINSTPLIALCKIDKLNLLKDKYGEIIIPAAVFQEITVKNDIVREQILSNSSWIHVFHVDNVRDKKMYKAKLHDGEVEVMILAQEINADLVMIDDDSARKTAQYLGLTITGTIGFLIRCKQEGLIDAVMPLITELTEKGIYISKSLVLKISQITNETQGT